MKDYTVLDGMITNQSSVLKAAYERGYSHGFMDGKEKALSENKKDYDVGYLKGYEAGVQAGMKNKAIVDKPKGKLKMLFT